MKKRFSDFVDLGKLQKLLNSLYEVTGITATIVDSGLTVLAQAGRSDVCAQFHGIHPETKRKCHLSTKHIFASVQTEDCVVHKCLNGLYDCTYPIMVEGEHLATLLFDQFLLEAPDEQFFRNQAATFGFDQEAYLQAIRKIPIIDKEKIVKLMGLYTELATLIAAIVVQGSEQGNMFEFLHQLMEAIPNPIFYKNTVGDYLGCNKAFEEFVGRSKEQLIGHSAVDLFPREISNVFTDTDSAIYKEAGVQNYEYKFTDQNGNTRHIYTSKAPYRNTFGAVAGVVGVINDMTERIEMEQALKDSEAKYKALFQHSLSGFIYFKVLRDELGNFIDCQVMEVNDAFERLTGVKQADIVNQRVSETILNSELNGAWREELQDIVLNRGSKMFEYYSKGFKRWLLVSAYSPQQDFLAIFLADIDKQKRSEEQAKYEAQHDLLTGLSNRRRLEGKLTSTLEKAATKKETVAVIFLDLDGFKAINDQWGHEAGDASLQEVAKRLQSCIRENDIVARFGGDEFVLLVPSLKSTDEAVAIAHRILDTCRKPLVVLGEQMPLSVSVGISFFPQDGEDAATLIRNADNAMYLSKKMGRDRISFANNKDS